MWCKARDEKLLSGPWGEIASSAAVFQGRLTSSPHFITALLIRLLRIRCCPHMAVASGLSLSLSLYSLTSLSTYCRQAGSFATNSVTSLAQQIANQPFGAKQWPRPEPPLPVHRGSGTNGWEPSEARSTHSARVTEWRKPPSTESGAARRAERRADEEDQVQLKTYRALLGLCCWSSIRKLIREVVNILFRLVRLSQWLYWTSGLRLICSHSSSRQ